MRPITANITTPGEFREENPYEELVSAFGTMLPNIKWKQWETEHPLLPALDPLNNPLPKGWSGKVVEVWQWRYKADDSPQGWRDANNFVYKDYQDFEKINFNLQTRRIYRSIEPAEPVKEGETGIIPVNLGVENGIDPCPFCGGKEGETVFLGYKNPRYIISCSDCNVRIEDDRKDKVQSKWNLRNGVTFWDKQSWLKEQGAQWQSQQDREGWVDVKERLPESELNVLLYCPIREFAHDKLIIQGWYQVSHGYEYWCSIHAHEDEYLTVTHWQPLPAPPQQALTQKDK